MITAALPTYKNAAIIWLQLESFCAQEDAPEWELIVCEEPSADMLGASGLVPYVSRLKAANCKRIVYLALSEWVPLGKKWLIIRDNMAPESLGLMLCASDNYSPADRFRKTADALEAGAEWSQFNSGYFYNIKDHQAGLFTAPPEAPALFMAVSTAKLKQVTAEKYPVKGVDTWLLRSTGAKVTDLGKAGGVHTDGFNTISHRRRDLYAGNDGHGLFKKVDADKVFNTLPPAIRERLKTLRK